MDDWVTILIPSYNRMEFFEECLYSALNQTHSNCKILLYDDGSEDVNLKRIQQVLFSLSSMEKKKITFEHSDINRGIGYARNYLLEHFDTPYACWLDSDDVLHSKRVEEQLHIIQSQSLGIVFCALVRFVRNDLTKIKKYQRADVTKYSDWDSLQYNAITPSGFFTQKLKQYKFNSQLTLGGEDVLWLYQLVRNKVKIGYLEEGLYFYREHLNRIGRKKLLEKNRVQKVIEENFLIEGIRRLEEMSI